jgi:hypothetical protein
MNNHDIDYNIEGQEMQFVDIFSAMPGNPAGRRQDEGSIPGGFFDLFGGR